MPEGTKDNTAVTRLIDLAHQRPLDTDDSLFAPPRQPLLPPPFPARGARSAAPAEMPPPLPRHRAPAATRTDLAAAPPAAAPRVTSEHDLPTRPFDLIEVEALADDLDGDEIAAAPRPPAVEPPTSSAEAAFWAGGVDVDVSVDLDDAPPVRLRAARRRAPIAPPIAAAPRVARGSRRSSNVGAIAWIAGAFVLGVAATAIIAWPRSSAPVAAVAPVAVAPIAVAPVAVAPIAVAPIAVAPIAVAPIAVAPIAVAPIAVAPIAVAPIAVAPVAAPRAPRPAAAPSARVAAKPTPPPRVARAQPTGGAVLMLGAKPPCDIIIDGKRTGLTTPQRSIAVAPGKHQVTLINKQFGIRESFSITASAGRPVKIIKDLTGKMRR